MENAKLFAMRSAQKVIVNNLGISLAEFQQASLSIDYQSNRHDRALVDLRVDSLLDDRLHLKLCCFLRERGDEVRATVYVHRVRCDCTVFLGSFNVCKWTYLRFPAR